MLNIYAFVLMQIEEGKKPLGFGVFKHYLFMGEQVVKLIL